jgi:hypothetical protein
MKPARNSGRIFENSENSENSPGERKGQSPQGRSKEDERKEALVLFAIAILFLANVVLYLCHHYGLTSLNESHPRTPVSARVIID